VYILININSIFSIKISMVLAKRRDWLTVPFKIADNRYSD